MSRALQFALFIFIFLALYAFMNYYVIGRLYSFFRLEKNVVFYFIFIFATLSYLIANWLESAFPGSVTRVVYLIASVWMGILLLAIFVFGVHDLLTPFGFGLKNPGIILVSIILILTTYSIINASFLHTNSITIESSKLSKELRIVQLSDLHIGPVRDGPWLDRIVTLTNEFKPDVVLITGDLFDGMKDYNAKEFLALNNIKAPIYLSIGNHEEFAGIENILLILKDTKVKVLRNASAISAGINIIGIDDAESKKQVEKVLPSIKFNSSKFTVLMYHRPDSFEYAVSKGVDLELSGHTHNGQIFPFNFIVRMFFSRIHGLYELDGKYLYTSFGSGTWGPPMRLGSENEIVLITVKPLKKS
jgi:predicted MPP superfamily phosphohydrolase